MPKRTYRVIDADGHVNIGAAPNRDDYAPPAYRDAIRAYLGRQSRRFRDLPGGGSRRDDGQVRPGEWDPHARIPDMDLEGIDTAVLVIGGNGEEWAGRDPDLASAVCRMFNDWMADYCAAYPKRLKGLVKLPWINVEAALAELQRAAPKPHVVGVLVPQHVREKNLDDPSFYPVYEAAQRLDLPICVHGGGQAADQVPIAIDRFKTRLEVHALTHPLGQLIATMCLSCGGVMERFPSLRFAFLEAGCGWVPYWVERLDEHYELLRHQAPLMKARPSAYLLSGRAFFSCEGDEAMLPAVIRTIGDRHLLYASDYCHWDCQFPDTVKIIARRRDIAPAAKRQILGRNAMRLYHLN